MMRAATRTGGTLMLLALPALALATITFERHWHWFQEDAGRSVELTGDGGYVVGAGTWIGGRDYGATLAWVDSLGDTVTVRHIAGLDNGAGYVCRVEDGGYVVAGTRDTLHVFAQKFGANGDSVWTYFPPHRGLVSAVIGTADGGCLIVGRIPDSMYDFGMVKLRADGTEDWVRYYEEPMMFDSFARDAAQTRDSGYILCGDAHDYMGSYVRLVRTGAAGESLWARSYHGSASGSLRAVSEMPDSGFLAVGLELDTAGGRPVLYMMRTNSAGTLLWTRDIASPGVSTDAAALCETRDSGYVIAGTIDWGDSARVWLVKLNANADTVWTSVLPGTGREEGVDVRQTKDGGYVIAGTSDSAGGSVLLTKTDSLGRVLSGLAEVEPAVRERIALSVTPNPASGVVRIDCSLPAKASAGLRLYDVTGRLVHSTFGLGLSGPCGTVRTSSFRLDLRSMPAGVYLLKLEYSGRTATRKLVVE
jgi:hypothetical protein